MTDHTAGKSVLDSYHTGCQYCLYRTLRIGGLFSVVVLVVVLAGNYNLGSIVVSSDMADTPS